MLKTFFPCIFIACLRCSVAKGDFSYCIILHPRFSSLAWDFLFLTFFSFLYFDFDLRSFQLCTYSVLVIVLVFMEIFLFFFSVRLDNAFTPFEMTALEMVSFLLSPLLSFFGLGLFISVSGKGAGAVQHVLQVQRILWSLHALLPGGLHLYSTLRLNCCVITVLLMLHYIGLSLDYIKTFFLQEPHWPKVLSKGLPYVQLYKIMADRS